VPGSGDLGRGGVRDQPVLAQAMLHRAFDASVPFSRVTADEAYGQVKYLRVWLEQHDCSYLLATRCDDDVVTIDAHTRRVDELIAALPAKARRRLSVGAGAHGPRDYDWARLPIRVAWTPGRGHWLLARRSISYSSEIAYTSATARADRACSTSPGSPVALAGRRVLPTGQERGRPGPLPSPNLAGLVCAHHPVHARPGLAVRRESPCRKRGIGVLDQDMINYTLPEIRRLLVHLILRHVHQPAHVWSWSCSRRRRQHQARVSHYRARGYPP